MRLFRDLRQRGYAGGYGVVAAYARRLRQAQGWPPGHRCARQPLPAVAEPSCQPLTPRRATWLVLRRETKRTEAEAQQLIQLHTQVWALHRQGWTAPAIAQHVGMGLRTVQRDLRSAVFAGRKRRSDHGESVLNPYKPYLLERWNAGCYNAMRLFRDLRQWWRSPPASR